MPDLPLTKIAETATTITLGWEPPEFAFGYVFYADLKRSHTLDGTRSTVKFAKGSSKYRVQALGLIAEGTYPPAVVPAPAFGSLLPTRIPRSAGPTVVVASLAELSAAINNVTAGSTIRISRSLYGGGRELVIGRNAENDRPITITADPGVVVDNFAQWYVTGSHLRFQGLEITGAFHAAIKPTSTAHHIEIEGCHIHDCAGHGILVTASAHHIQVIGNRIHHCGSNGNKDHGLYFAWTGGDGSAVYNNVFWDNWAYNVQLYPEANNLIFSCNTVDGGISQPDARGGVVIGSEGQGMHDVDVVGLIVTNAPELGLNCYSAVDRNMRAYDSLSFANQGGNWDAPAPGWTFTNLQVGDPLYVDRAANDYRLKPGSPAIGLIKPERYGYVPPFDIDGRPRVTADAGAYAS